MSNFQPILTLHSQSLPLDGLSLCANCEKAVRACGCIAHSVIDNQRTARTVQSRNSPEYAWLPVRIGGYR